MVLLPSTALAQSRLILVLKWELMYLSLRTAQLPKEHVWMKCLWFIQKRSSVVTELWSILCTVL